MEQDDVKKKTSATEIEALLVSFKNTHNTLEYTAHSISKKLGLDRITVTKYCEKLNIPYKETHSWQRKQVKKRPVLFQGTWYSSIADASKATGVHRNTIEYQASEDIKKKYNKDYSNRKDDLKKKAHLRKNQSWAQIMFENIKERVKKNSSYENLEVSITTNDLEHLLSQTSGKCFSCGLLFSEVGEDLSRHDRPSPDRIDSTKGYTKQNTRIICHLCNVNHRAELFSKNCSDCKSWILHNASYCHLCGTSQQAPSLEEARSQFASLKSQLLRLEQPSNRREKLDKLIKIPATIKGKLLPINNAGVDLVNSFMPNILKVYKSNLPSWHSILTDSNLIDQVLQKMIDSKIRINVNNLKNTIRSMNTVAEVYNFRPLTARYIYENFVPQNGIVYDYSCGFGGRMLGAAISANSVKYIGTDPNTETHSNLLKLKDFLVDSGFEATRFEIYNECSEDFKLPELEGKVDAAFSSPPYYDIERYCDEPTQSWIKHRTYSSWFNDYMKKTIENIFFYLKPGGKFIINIKNIGSYALASDIQKISEAMNFKLIDTLELEFPHYKSKGPRTEPVMIFEKI